MNSSRVFRKFVLAYLLLHVVAAVTFLTVAGSWISREMQTQSFHRMELVAKLLRHQLADAGISITDERLIPQIEELGRQMEMRLTVIAADGRVVVDSESSANAMENHGTRPEIIEARRNQLGTAFRKSATVNLDSYYVAIPFNEKPGATSAGFIRVAESAESFLRLQNGVLRYLWLSGLVLAGISAAVMWRFIQKEMQPLDSFSQAARRIALGQYDSVPSSLNRNDEWRTLSDAFRQMLDELSMREARLRDNSSRIEAVLTSMVEGVLAIDSTGQVILANEAACNMLVVDQTQLLGRKLLEVVRIPDLQRAVEETQLRRMFSRVEFQTMTEPRKQIAARVSVMANAPHPGVAIVLNDVTEIRQLESMRRDFVANVSHELKTPLAAIKAYAETLQMGALHDPEKNVYFVNQIEIHAELLNQQVQDLLTLAKMESGQSAIQITAVPVDDVCQESVDGFLELAAAKKISLTFQSRTKDLTARAGHEELLTVINNLLSNAIRYTSEQGRIEVTSFAESRSAVIEVSDTGIGIAPQHQPRIFERFYRVDQARSRELGGTGLGLSIVKHLVQSMGGSVHLESQLGKGTTFRIKLPLHRETGSRSGTQDNQTGSTEQG